MSTGTQGMNMSSPTDGICLLMIDPLERFIRWEIVF